MINKNFRIDYELPMNFISQSLGGKDNIYAELQQYAREELNVNDASLFKLKRTSMVCCKRFIPRIILRVLNYLSKLKKSHLFLRALMVLFITKLFLDLLKRLSPCLVL